MQTDAPFGQNVTAHMSEMIDAMTKAEFEAVVAEAIGDLPEGIREIVAECAIIVEDWADEELLRELGDVPVEETPYGFYDGTPFGERLPSDGTPHLPDRILLFRGPLIEDFPDREELVEQIRITIVHEVGHMIGFDEEDLEERGLE